MKFIKYFENNANTDYSITKNENFYVVYVFLGNNDPYKSLFKSNLIEFAKFIKGSSLMEFEVGIQGIYSNLDDAIVAYKKINVREEISLNNKKL